MFKIDPKSHDPCDDVILVITCDLTVCHCVSVSIQVAYHGVPDKAYEVFVNALRSRYLQQRLIIPDLEDRNPAGQYIYIYIIPSLSLS